jgi:hypothetical protein
MTVGNAVMSFQGNLVDMTTLLVKMEDTGDLDLSIIPKIEDSMRIVAEIQSKIADDKTMELKANFLAYHIVRNINLTLEKMRFRFANAKLNHDNPIVAEDSLALVPAIAESFQVAERLVNGELSYADEKMIVGRIQALRNSMYSSSMLITGEEESKRVSSTELEEQGRKLASAIKDIYAKKQ